ncbi:MAG TPA: signal peptidase II [Blastocatellia bacterium]|nr:signal peptidase II [Blastocatellia bacterium]
MSSEAVPANIGSTKIRYLFVTAVVLMIDQFTKYWVSINLREGDEVQVIPGFFKFSYTENPGIAFGMLNNSNVKWALVAVSLGAILVVVYYITRTASSNRLLLWSLALLAAGISGNLIDRVRMGRVIDFILIYYKHYEWPVFNIADTAITIGAALMAIELFLPPQHERTPAPEPIEPTPVEGTQE